MKHTILSIIAICLTTGAALAHEALQGPTETIQWDQDRAYNGYTLFSARGKSYLIDMEGQVINTWPIGTTPQFLDNGNLLDASKDDPSGFGGFRELDWEGNVVWSYDERREAYSPHHDWVRIYNKALDKPTMLYIANRMITHQEAIDVGCDPAHGPYDGAQLDSIVEIDMEGNIIWEWRFFDHTIQDVDPTKPNYVGQGKTVADYPHRIDVNIPGRPVKRDWLHCNSLDYNPELGYVVTNSVQGEFYVIDHDGTFVAGDPDASMRLAAGPKGDFRYRFGDPARYGQGDPPSILPDWTQSTTGHKQIGGAHDIHWIDEGLPGAGNFLIFNNAQYLFERTPQSYILEINGMLDHEGRETGKYVNPPDAGYFRWEHPNRDSQKTPRWVSNQIVWMYYSRSNQGFFSHIGSGAQRLPNGNTLICSMTEGHFFEVTPQAEVVWEYINPVTTDGVVRVLKDAFPMSNAVFRAYRYGADHPALSGRELKPIGRLTDLAEQGVIKTIPPGRGPVPGQSDMQPTGRRGPGQGGQPPQQRGPRGQGGAQSGGQRPNQSTPVLNPEMQFQFTEGPVADASGNVYFTDVRAGCIYRRNIDGQLSVVLEKSGGANGLAIDAAGRLVLCQGELGRVARMNQDGSLTLLAEAYNGNRFNKPNDLWIAPSGGIYFSDPLYGQGTKTQDGEHVYHIPPSGKPVIRVADDLVRPNGVVGSADGQTLYITDQGAGKTYRYAIQSDGSLANKTLFADIGADGLALDSHGNLYLAEQGVVMLDSTGQRLRTFETPERPTNICLINNESKLFVTARTRILSIPLGASQDEPRGEARGDQGGQRGDPRGGDPNRKPWLVVHAAEMDANTDGFLERTELQRACRDVFSMYDRNEDGMLTSDEYAGGHGEAPHTMGGFVKQHSDEIDRDADERITLDELLSVASELFDKSDRERIGRIVADPDIAPSNNSDYAPPKSGGR
ncbi:SMP-30/gluconolactonase/LRE family protein [Novipirellula artificiosorum]|uniref:Gluconolactonase n=1 Tax=Novipirellula artificiosorum TaxID=2528016 RepID=A0A5C6DR78_9BACT|nr:SMP-30/gluconolactonase/LRE family protein [Novipirellula artificiosorum]TWU39783.1 Gluconolactonase precursor [Novipirellula artificiosorum]